MCVIFIAEKTRPTEEQVAQAFEQNDAGAGIAYRKDGLVHFEKGLDVNQIKKLCAEVPLPFIAHFRIPSGNFPKRDDLCHPFPVEKAAPLMLKGTTKGTVLFHNGHWSRWQEYMLDAVTKSGTKLPHGKWSDSRAMAFLTSIYGLGFIELIPDQKIALFGANGIEVAGTWMPMADGFWASNKSWENNTSYRRTMCAVKSCSRIRIYNSEYCYEHREFERKASPDAKAIEGVVVSEEKAEKKPESGGTPRHVIPFIQAAKLLAEHKISKNQYKKLRKRYQQEQEKLSRQRLAEAERQLKAVQVVTLH